MENQATEIVIALDRKHKAIRSGTRWAVQKLQASGDYDMVASWDGGRRSLVHWCETNGVIPSREAEQALALIPEGTGFRERS